MNSVRERAILLLACAVLTNISSSSAEDVDASSFPVGTVVPKVVCAGDPAQTYSLYLPSTFTPTRQWPIIYVFDPGARGESAVEAVRVAAEKSGYIVAASNNSRNGAENTSSDAARAMWRDTSGRFPLDDHRRYFAGMSGGARVAVAMALACGDCAAGVIANAAGFPNGVIPTHSLKFAYFAAVGNADFNFEEFLRLRDPLDKIGARYRIRIFPGSHGWAPAGTWLEALEWMDFQAMSAGTLPRDATRIQQALGEELALARRFESQQQVLDAYREYQSIVRDFAGLADIAAAADQAAKLKAGKALKNAEREEIADVNEQTQLALASSAQIQAAAQGDLSIPDLLDLKRSVADLRRRAAEFSDQNSRQALILRRALGGLLVQAYESGDNDLALKKYGAALSCFDVAAAGSLNAGWAHYQRARVYARIADRRNMFAELKLAAELGFHDGSALDSPDFQVYRALPEYQGLIVEWKAKAKAKAN